MTTPGAHSAGSVFVNVVPSFKGVQKAIEEQVEKIGGQAGTKAGQKFSEGFEKEAGKVGGVPSAPQEAAAAAAGKKSGEQFAGNFRNSVDRVLSSSRSDIGEGISKDLDKVFVQLQKLRDAKVGVNFTAREALDELARLQAVLQTLQKNAKLDIEVRSNATVAAKRISQEINRLRPEVVVEVSINQGAFNRRLQSLVAEANAALPDIKLKADATDAERKIAAVKAKLLTLGNAKIGIDVTAKEAIAQMAALQATLQAISRDAKIDVDVRSNAAEAGALLSRELERISKLNPPKVKIEAVVANEGAFAVHLREMVTKANAALPDIKLTTDSTDVERTVADVKARLASLGGKKIGVDFSAKQANAEIRDLTRLLAALDNKDVDIRIRTDARKARVELDEVGRAADRAARSGDQAGVAFRAFNGVLLASVAIGPLLIPILAGIAAGMIGIFVAVIPLVAALGVLTLGLAGIGEAFTATSDASRESANDTRQAASTMRAASNSVRDAVTSLARAREDAARSAVDSAQRIEDAQRNLARAQQESAQRIADAERDLADAQREAVDVQNDLIEARQRAADQQEDLALRARGGALAERQGVIDVFQATVTNTNTQADPAATNLEKEQASINLGEAQLRLEQIRIENGRLGEEQAEVNKKGVEGSDEVVAAQEEQLAIQQRIQDAALAVQEAQLQGQRNVEDATRDLTRAYEDQRRSGVDSQQAIQDATLSLADAQQNYADALYETSVQGSAAQQRLRESLEGLGPAAREFVTYLQTLKPYLQELRTAAQEGFLPGLQAGMESFMASSGPGLLEFVTVMSTALGDLAQRAGEAFANPVWQTFFDTMTEFGPIFVEQFGSIFGNILEGIASLFTALAPFGEEMGIGLIDLTQKFADWAAGLSESEGFQEFLDYLRDILPEVGELIGAMIGAFGNLAVALAPYAGYLLDAVTAFFDWIADLDPDTLFVLAVAVLAVLLAFQTLVALSAVVRIFTTLINSPFRTASIAIGVVAGALILLGAVFVILWIKSETFRNIVTAAWEAVQRAFQDTVDWIVRNKEIFIGLASIIAVLLIPTIVRWATQTAISVGTSVALWIWYSAQSALNAIKAVAAWVLVQLAAIKTAIVTAANIAWMIAGWVLLGTQALIQGAKIAIGWLLALGPIGIIIIAVGLLVAAVITCWDWVSERLDWLGEKWDELGNWWDKIYQEKIAPIFGWFGERLGELREVFRGVVEDIGVIWDGIIDIAKKPVRFVIESIINDGLISGINGVIDFLGGEPHTIPKIPPPDGVGSWDTWATGGRIPGYSPTRTADNIPAWLTAGEFVHPVDSVDYYGEDIMEMIRKRRIPREALALYGDGGMAGYADGGMVGGRVGFAGGGPTWDVLWDLISKEFASTGIRLTSAYRPGDSGYHGSGQAIDVAARVPYPGTGSAAQMLDYNRWIATTYPNATELIHSSGYGHAINLYHGREHSYDYGTRNAHYNHVHWAVAELAAGLRLGSGAFQAQAIDRGAFWAGVLEGFTDPLAYLADIALDGFGAAGDWLDSPFGQMMLDIPAFVLETVGEGIMDILNPLADLKMGLIGGAQVSGSSEVMDLVQNVANQRGWGTGYEWSALSTLIAKESSWNPNAQNPNSTAYGLFQFLDGTWAETGYAKTSDPHIQSLAGMQYIADRYGTPSAAWNFHLANGWYGRGGPVTEGGNDPADGVVHASLYDEGGKLPVGLSVVLNNTGRPENVFRDDQLAALVQGRPGVESLVGGDVNFPIMDTNSPVAVADELMFRLRQLRTAGRYADAAGVGS